MPQSHPTFLTCQRCQRIQWFTNEYMAAFGNIYRCPRCGCSEWRNANVYATFFQRLYLLRWFVWQQWYVNRRGTPGADPYWFLKPWLVMKVAGLGWHVMEHYNAIEAEGDNECPGNIETLRAELSSRDANTDSRLDYPACLLPRRSEDTV